MIKDFGGTAPNLAPWPCGQDFNGRLRLGQSGAADRVPQQTLAAPDSRLRGSRPVLAQHPYLHPYAAVVTFDGVGRHTRANGEPLHAHDLTGTNTPLSTPRITPMATRRTLPGPLRFARDR